MTAMAQHEIGPFTIDDWHALPAREDGSRLELIEGYWLLTSPPTGQHQWAEKKLIKLLDAAIESTSSDLYTVSGVGVEIGTADRTALVPDIAVLDIRPVGTSFAAENVLLAGEIWSPANTSNEQLAKFHACENAGVPFFWSVAQDRGGPVELAAYRLDRGRYVRETTAKADGGAARISASPVPVELDVTALRA